MKIVDAQQMQELDRQTLVAQQISSLELMERASQALVTELVHRFPPSRSFLVFAGPGNNGGDALAVARLLLERGYTVKTYLFNISKSLSADCEANRDRLCAFAPDTLTEVMTEFEAPQVTENTVIIDGLFGTGMKRVLSGGFAALVRFINMLDATVVSIDMPSGLLCGDNSDNVLSHVVHADLTLTFQLPKLAQLLADNQPLVGELKILDIGLSAEHIGQIASPFRMLTKTEVQPLLKCRPHYGHKGTFGHGLLIAGSFGMAGAAILGARAAFRVGLGKLTLHTPLMNNDILQSQVPEAVLSHDSSDSVFTKPISTENFTAMAIGPAIGIAPETATAFIEQVRHARIPIVIDADGLNILAGHKGWLKQLPKEAILTPHPLEFKRLGLQSNTSFSALAEARNMAMTQGLFIVLKGHYTAICAPDGSVAFNTTGNSGMATAGAGDVLTGILTGLLAQGYTPHEATRLGVYLHGLAGDCAAEALGEECLMASDLINYLPKAFQRLREKG